MIRMLIAGLAAAVAGCASNAPPEASGGAAGVGGAGAPAATALGAIPQGALPKGECGLILWTLDQREPVPVLRHISGKGAEISLGGRILTLSLASAEGQSAFGVSETARFVGEGVTAVVKVRFGLGFEGGTYLERGVVTIERADGWSLVAPAAGVAGCRPK